jgi:hypothetical protein
VTFRAADPSDVWSGQILFLLHGAAFTSKTWQDQVPSGLLLNVLFLFYCDNANRIAKNLWPIPLFFTHKQCALSQLRTTASLFFP